MSRRQFSRDAPHSQGPKQTAPENKQVNPCFSAIECYLQVHSPKLNWGEPSLQREISEGRVTELEKRRH